SQGGHVALGRVVATLVLALGIDHQAGSAIPDRGGADPSLDDWSLTVHVLPGADAQAGGAQRGDQPRRELRPRRRAVGALDDQRADAVVPGLGDDLRDVATGR